jgi:hypothetical protein
MSKEIYNEAFLNTVFKVILSLSEFYEIRVGQENVLVDLKLSGVSSWAYITAWNPLPTTCTLEENRMRDQSIRADLDALSLEYIEGIGEALDGKWYEESLFIKNITKEQAESLAYKYGQVAYLFANGNDKAELIYTQLQ